MSTSCTEIPQCFGEEVSLFCILPRNRQRRRYKPAQRVIFFDGIQAFWKQKRRDV